MTKDVIFFILQACVFPALYIFWRETRKSTAQGARIESRIDVLEEAISEVKHLAQAVSSLDKTLAIIGVEIKGHHKEIDKIQRRLHNAVKQIANLNQEIAKINQRCEDNHK